jgi:hypothetical protein
LDAAISRRIEMLIVELLSGGGSRLRDAKRFRML